MSAPASKDSSRPFTVHDLVRLDRVSDPRVSPDGRHVAYTLRSTDYEANKGVQQLWLLDLASGASRALTSSASNHSPRWSADGRTLYFLSSRGGSSQVWRLSLAGG